MLISRSMLTAGIALAMATSAGAAISQGEAKRTAADGMVLQWTASHPVDIYETADGTFASPGARLVTRSARNGRLELEPGRRTRRYFILVDRVDHTRLKVAERLAPLQQGSNFRDIGGYVGAGGKRVKWGSIYRSAGQPLLTESDLSQILDLGIAQLVDLRSTEERNIAPSRITGIPSTSINYSLSDMIGKNVGAVQNGYQLYRSFPEFLTPQVKVVFADLLDRRVPLAINCSAGQDRTGFATAMILMALGVPRTTVVQDYLLSMDDRRPEFEMPELHPEDHPKDPVVKMFSMYRARPNWRTPDRLIDAQGRPFLLGALDEIDAKWGSVDTYLRQKIGLTALDLAKLRALYLE